MTRKRYHKRNVIGGTMLSVKDVAERYGFHPNTARAWASRDGLRHVRHGPGGKMFFRKIQCG